MFEGFTLEAQRQIEAERGWKPGYSALTYCTAEAVLFRKTRGVRDVLDYEIFDAERISGAPDCLGKRQGKWGTYVRPTDPTATHAIQRGLKELFGWDLLSRENLCFVGLVGPWLHKATVKFEKSGLLQLSVLEAPAEQTPFEAKLFYADVTGYDIGTEGNYLKATRGGRWITLKDLIKEQGQNPDYLYWQMIAMCGAVAQDSLAGIDGPHYLAPGEYLFQVTTTAGRATAVY